MYTDYCGECRWMAVYDFVFFCCQRFVKNEKW